MHLYLCYESNLKIDAHVARLLGGKIGSISSDWVKNLIRHNVETLECRRLDEEGPECRKTYSIEVRECRKSSALHPYKSKFALVKSKFAHVNS